MTSLILGFSGRILLPLSIAFSLWLLWRGHNEPGGGFVGGLVAAAGIAVHALARGPAALRAVVRARPTTIAAVGVLIALASSIPGFAAGAPLLTHRWWISESGLALGTTLLISALREPSGDKPGAGALDLFVLAGAPAQGTVSRDARRSDIK